MRDLAVASVADDRRLEQGRGLAVRNARQELLEPDREQLPGCARAMHSGLDQRRRQELVAARLPRLAIAVGAEPVTRAVADERRRARDQNVGPFERQDQREGCVEMRADADRVGQDRQIS